MRHVTAAKQTTAGWLQQDLVEERSRRQTQCATGWEKHKLKSSNKHFTAAQYSARKSGGRRKSMQRAIISRGTWQVPLNVREGLCSSPGGLHQARNMKHAARQAQVHVLPLSQLIYVAAGLPWGILLTTPGEPVPTCSTAHLEYLREPSLLRFLRWPRTFL